jgi:hypothetical protein
MKKNSKKDILAVVCIQIACLLPFVFILSFQDSSLENYLKRAKKKQQLIEKGIVVYQHNYRLKSGYNALFLLKTKDGKSYERVCLPCFPNDYRGYSGLAYKCYYYSDNPQKGQIYVFWEYPVHESPPLFATRGYINEIPSRDKTEKQKKIFSIHFAYSAVDSLGNFCWFKENEFLPEKYLPVCRYLMDNKISVNFLAYPITYKDEIGGPAFLTYEAPFVMCIDRYTLDSIMAIR